MALQQVRNQKVDVLFFYPLALHLGEVVPVLTPQMIDVGIASIGSCVEQWLSMRWYFHHSADYEAATVRKLIHDKRPAFIGISCGSYNRFSSFEIARIAKELDPSIFVILGGTHAAFLDGQILEHYPEVDFVVRGEAEVAFCKLLDCLRSRKDPIGVEGISFRRGRNVIRTKDQPRVKNLDELPLIDYGKMLQNNLPLESRSDLRDIAFVVEASRGCPFQCLYCGSVGLWERKFSTRSPERLVEQIRLLPKEVKLIGVSGLNFTYDKKHARDICARFRKDKMNIPWGCSTRVDLVDEAILRMMQESGCKTISYGVESLSESSLRVMGKKYTPRLAIKNVNLTVSFGIKAMVHMILGFPGETEQTLKENLKNSLAFHPSVKIIAEALQIHPGAPLYQVALREGFDESIWLDEKVGIPAYTKAVLPERMTVWLNALKIVREHHSRSRNILNRNEKDVFD